MPFTRRNKVAETKWSDSEAFAEGPKEEYPLWVPLGFSGAYAFVGSAKPSLASSSSMRASTRFSW